MELILVEALKMSVRVRTNKLEHQHTSTTFTAPQHGPDECDLLMLTTSAQGFSATNSTA
jgi:hypothetical protein